MSGSRGILAGAMSERSQHLSTAISIAAFAILSACAAAQPPVVEYLDELTGVTITHSRTPFIMSTDTYSDVARDYMQIGAIEVNRMGTHQYYLWLGISEVKYTKSAYRPPRGFESIVFIVGEEKFQLDIGGWTQEAIGASEPVYEKLFQNTVDAYYEVTLEQIDLLTDADRIRFRTIGPAPKEYAPWYKSITAKDDLAEFLRIVSQ